MNLHETDEEKAERIAELNAKLDEAREQYKAKKYLNALALCRTAKWLDPHNLDILWLEGLIHLEKGTLESHWDTNDTIAACRCFEAVAAEDPTRAEAFFYNGVAIVRWGNNYRIAIENFDKALELDPGNELAIRYRDICRKCLAGDTPGAQKDLNALLKSLGADYLINLSINQVMPSLKYLDFD